MLRDARHATHLPLDRQRDATLDFFRCLARHLGDDLHLDILDIRKRFDRQILQRAYPHDTHDGKRQQNKRPLIDREVDELAQHYLAFWLSSEERRRAPTVTTLSPGLISESGFSQIHW